MICEHIPNLPSTSGRGKVSGGKICLVDGRRRRGNLMGKKHGYFMVYVVFYSISVKKIAKTEIITDFFFKIFGLYRYFMR